MPEIQFKTFDIIVNAANAIYPKEFELDKNVAFIRGFHFTSDRDDLLFYRGKQKIEFNSKEYFPENYESKNFQWGLNVPPNCRYLRTGKVAIGNGKIKITFSDTDHASTTFAAYRVTLNVMCEMKSEWK